MFNYDFLSCDIVLRHCPATLSCDILPSSEFFQICRRLTVVVNRNDKPHVPSDIDQFCIVLCHNHHICIFLYFYKSHVRISREKSDNTNSVLFSVIIIPKRVFKIWIQSLNTISVVYCSHNLSNLSHSGWIFTQNSIIGIVNFRKIFHIPPMPSFFQFRSTIINNQPNTQH